ncbi:hypothetical protein [Derxia gummosa]|uniref:Uncharacterized protein n=1 Tax=Derxia gummosa DSM 723 TaxID=1121388 RepID=A0A8B6X982_9BURK|nr:hypothetical protein [Derxia gummosa]
MPAASATAWHETHVESLLVRAWSIAHTASGHCLLSNRAGKLRLLVPPSFEGALDEMRTGRSVTIEPSAETPDAMVEIVFEDGSETPFAIAQPRCLIDGTLGRALFVPFTVWTTAGKQMTLRADVLL